jgi:hypothetical protein
MKARPSAGFSFRLSVEQFLALLSPQKPANNELLLRRFKMLRTDDLVNGSITSAPIGATLAVMNRTNARSHRRRS